MLFDVKDPIGNKPYRLSWAILSCILFAIQSESKNMPHSLKSVLFKLRKCYVKLNHIFWYFPSTFWYPFHRNNCTHDWTAHNFMNNAKSRLCQVAGLRLCNFLAKVTVRAHRKAYTHSHTQSLTPTNTETQNKHTHASKIFLLNPNSFSPQNELYFKMVIDIENGQKMV